MKIAKCTLKSVAPYSQSRFHNTPKLDKETADAYEQRTWREKAHYTKDGSIFIPPMALKQSLDSSAKFTSRQVPGKGKTTYTKHFLSGVLVTDPIVLPVNYEEADSWGGMVNADGIRGSGKRVWRIYPQVNEWKGVAVFYVLDDLIIKEVFEETLREAGRFIGLGRFRPQNGGYYGRYDVEKISWE